MPTIATIAGIIFSVLGFFAVDWVSRKAKPFTLLALISYLVITQSIGFVFLDEPASTEYFLGWVLGGTFCAIRGLYLLQRRSK
ncbi:MAG: hypothetical protein LCH63_21260 [Candidatus Melainabacteria bacterium]|jgi:hypothetical protein|nr:hypothetical protein [Candidatus Melainabacteria bacterium]